MNTRNTQRNPRKSQSTLVRFLRLRLNDYGIFQGLHEFEFNRQQTFIDGDRGAGRTTAAKALIQLGPVKGVTVCAYAKQPNMFVEVETYGDRQLIRKYRDLIYLNCESAAELALRRESKFAKILNRTQRRNYDAETKKIFEGLLKHKLTCRGFDALIMAAGVRTCLGYASIFAARKVLQVDIPLVGDSIFGTLDESLRQGVREFLLKEPSQQIHFCWTHELRELGKRPHYILQYPAVKRNMNQPTGATR